MRAHAMTGAAPLRDFQALARRAAEAGFAGLVVTESGRTAYLSCAAAALSGADLDLATGVAVAFPRSPMVTAATAWELADVSGGRFRLGLGTQVRAHIERRYASPFDPPGPRLREYVLAIKACFAAFRDGGPLAFEGEHYPLSLLPPIWSPGPIDAPDPAVDVAAVNPWMVRMAGEVADGVHVHPLNTATYLRETLVPNLAAGAERAGRDPAALAVFVPLFTVAGDTPEERAPWREIARTQIAFYGSTPAYRTVLDLHGWGDLHDELYALSKRGRWDEMSTLIDDDVLNTFAVVGGYSAAAAELTNRYGDHVHRLTLTDANDPQPTRWATIAEALRQV